MNEAEIDALMAGQEDENGCVNYEGKPPHSHGFLCFSMEPFRPHWFFPPPSVLSSCCSFCQAHHVCVRTPTIAHVQTPWCRDIHSLFPEPPKEAGEQKRTMRYQFLNPSILFFFFGFFCPNGAVLFFSSLPPALLKAAPIAHLSITCLIGVFFPIFF